MKKIIELEMRKKLLHKMIEKYEDEIEHINETIDLITEAEYVTA